MPGPPKLVGSGGHADVYDLGDGRVLRRYRDAAAVAGREAAVMVHALSHGVPVPEVFDVSGADIVMEHAAGPTMLQDVTRRPWTLDRHARLLTALHSTVHAVPALSWLRAPFGDGAVLLHTDLHPGNVILTRAGPRLIDWQGARPAARLRRTLRSPGCWSRRHRYPDHWRSGQWAGLGRRCSPAATSPRSSRWRRAGSRPRPGTGSAIRQSASPRRPCCADCSAAAGSPIAGQIGDGDPATGRSSALAGAAARADPGAAGRGQLLPGL